MKILVADDHPLFRSGLVWLVRQFKNDAEILQAIDYPSAISLCADRRFELGVIDLYMPGFDDGAGLCQLREKLPETPLVVVSAMDSQELIQNTLAMGVQGYVLKSSDNETFLSALRLVMSGDCFVSSVPAAETTNGTDSPRYNGSGLTKREIEVLQLLAEGFANKQIARQLEISQATVKTHIISIYRALDVHNRTQASRAAQQLGLL